MNLNREKLKGFYFALFVFRGGGLERNPRKKRGTTVSEIFMNHTSLISHHETPRFYPRLINEGQHVLFSFSVLLFGICHVVL